MRKIIILSIITVAASLLIMTFATGCKADSQRKVLKVGMELAYPPFETKDLQGNPSGVSVDFAKDLAKFLNMDLKIENTNWSGLIPALQTGQVDLVISSMTITDERKKTVDFSDPYAKALLAMLINKNSDVNSIEDLNSTGKVTVVKNGTTAFTYAQKNLTKGTVNVLSDVSACVTEVLQGKADAFIYDQLTVYQNQQLHPDNTKAVFIAFQDAEEWGVAVKKNNADLLNEVNSFIKNYREEKGFEKLTEKYLKKEKEEFDRLGFQFFF